MWWLLKMNATKDEGVVDCFYNWSKSTLQCGGVGGKQLLSKPCRPCNLQTRNMMKHAL
jgi:hypothetical protein